MNASDMLKLAELSECFFLDTTAVTERNVPGIPLLSRLNPEIPASAARATRREGGFLKSRPWGGKVSREGVSLII